MYRLTENGKKTCENYIAEIIAKRKEILDAGKDTAEDTNIPKVKDIEDDLNFFGVDEDGEYYNTFGVTDHEDADRAILLVLDKDFVEAA